MTDILRQLTGDALAPWLLTIIAALIVIVVILLVAIGTMMIQVWVERRVVAFVQDRVGPNRVGPAGILQSVADGVKMFTKEDIVPRAADPWVHLLAPIVAVSPVFLMFAVLPWGRGAVPTQLSTGALFILAVSSVAGVGLMMAGWSSNNKFSLLGALRAVAQLISYEIPAVLSMVSAVLIYNTMVMGHMPEAQAGIPILGQSIQCTVNCSPWLYTPMLDVQGQLSQVSTLDLGLGWFVFTPVGLLGFVIFFICILAEGERTPFDIPEADSEIVAGHTTEYSGMKFALFYIGQYVLNFALSILVTTVFLGGWQGPGVAALASNPDPKFQIAAGILSLGYLLLKVWIIFFFMVLLRGALPRLRVDQLMNLAWKFLLPLSLINIGSAALWVTIMRWGSSPDWTIQFFGVDALGWLAQASPLLRQLVAIVVTAIINILAVRAFLRSGNAALEDRSTERLLVQAVAE